MQRAGLNRKTYPSWLASTCSWHLLLNMFKLRYNIQGSPQKKRKRTPRHQKAPQKQKNVTRNEDAAGWPQHADTQNKHEKASKLIRENATCLDTSVSRLNMSNLSQGTKLSFIFKSELAELRLRLLLLLLLLLKYYVLHLCSVLSV